MKKTIAIIPARGGSKRIPRKNIAYFLGQPMIKYAIDACLKSGIFDEVMVSTDDEEIAKVAVKYGAKVPFMRNKKTSDDYATTFDVIDEVINRYKDNGINFDIICCVYPCVPFLTASTLKNALIFMTEKDADAVLPVCQYPVPIEWAMKIENNTLIPYNRDTQNIRSQDIEKKYFDCGMFYFCKTNSIYENNSLLPTKSAPYIISNLEMQDIDTEEDWKMAEIKYKIIYN